MSSGRTAAVGVLAVVGLCCGVSGLVSSVCTGPWVMFGPVNYAGCDTQARPSGLTVTDLTGVYRSGYGATLELRADGTFTATDFENSFGDYELGADADFPRTGYVSAPGTWRFMTTGDSTGDVLVQFTANEYQTFNTALHIGGSRSSPRLYQDYDDPDVCNVYRFKRV